jgi:GNAT superfamily N-acetyltransferase
MSWRMSHAVGEFLDEAGEFLHAHRARNTVLITVSETLRVTGAVARAEEEKNLPLMGWWRSEDGGSVDGAFLHTPPFPVLLSAMTAEAATALAGQLAAGRRQVRGVNGEERNARAFADAWRDRRIGTDVRVLRRMRLFRLGELTWPDPRPGGRPRLATSQDRELLINWFEAFSRDVGEPEMDHEPAVDDRLSYDGLTLWEKDGQPVSLAGVTRTVAGMVRVGPVYTPPELRGRGYAGGVTSTVSQAALDAGTTDVLLYTDLANPTSNALYQRLGYRPVEDRVMLSFG